MTERHLADPASYTSPAGQERGDIHRHGLLMSVHTGHVRHKRNHGAHEYFFGKDIGLWPDQTPVTNYYIIYGKCEWNRSMFAMNTYRRHRLQCHIDRLPCVMHTLEINNNLYFFIRFWMALPFPDGAFFRIAMQVDGKPVAGKAISIIFLRAFLLLRAELAATFYAKVAVE